ncbi:MAG: hypothetical protein IK092_00385, partial [Muribaculaceae bacterium]|nr:hypothetical protein [Muribaculaceae bacterium]
MKRLIIAAITLAALSTIGANAAKPTISLRGVEYTVDTLAHVYIGPGTTHTSLLLEHGNKHLQVYYSTTDINQPNVTLKAVNGKDKMAECETVSGMAERKTAPGNRYFLGINGDFWVTTGRTKRGESMVGTPRSTSMAEGIIYKAVSTDDEYQFTYNQDKNLWMGKVIFSGTVTDSNGATARVGGINTGAYGGVITVYNSTYFKGTDQNPPCAEVSIRYADGETFDFGKDCRFIVTSDPSTEGDMTVPADGMVLHGRGTTKAFIEGLHNGDEITMSITATLNDEQIEPSEIISGASLDSAKWSSCAYW